MNKRGILFFILLLIVAAIITVAVVSCNSVKTPKMYVYNMLTTEDNEVVVLARNTETEYANIAAKHIVQNTDDLLNVNNLSKMTTNVVEELLNYVLFVQNTEVSAKNLENAYNEYISAKQFADEKLEEAKNIAASANWVDITEVMVERYSDQLIKYNNFANELFEYTTKACFANLPKTVKYTTLSFIQNFNSRMIKLYVEDNKQSTNIDGIQENSEIYNKYTKLKTAKTELTQNNSKEAIEFIEGFYTFKAMDALYDAYSSGKTNLEKYVKDDTNYTASELEEQVKAKQAICKFITLDSYID